MKYLLITLTLVSPIFAAAAQLSNDVQASDDVKTVKCEQRICEGDRVMDSKNYVGIVEEIFSDGSSKVDYGPYGVRYPDTSKLSKAVKCFENKKPCVNDRINNNDIRHPSTILEIFENGKSVIDMGPYGVTVYTINANDAK